MTKQEFETWALGCGWTKDAYGHFHKGDMRFKVQDRSVRMEKSYRTPDTQYSKGEQRWLRLRSGFFSKLSISPDGKLVGMTK